MRRQVRAVLVGVIWVLVLSTAAHAQTTGSREGPRPSRFGTAAAQPVSSRVGGGVVPGLMATTIHWTRWSLRLSYGAAAVLEGQVVSDDGALPGAEVVLYARRVDQQRWVRVATAESSQDRAVFRFADLVPSGITEYRAVYQGDLVHARSEGTRTVAVARRVRDGLRRSASRPVLAGRVAPAYRGGRVLLQRQACSRCRWSTTHALRTSRSSRWRTALAVPPAGRTWRYRVVVPADGRFVRSLGDRVWSVRRH